MRCFVRFSTRSTAAASTEAGEKMTTSVRRVAVVTIVRAESDVGLPNGPVSSASVSRPATCTVSLRMPAYSSPGRTEAQRDGSGDAVEVVQAERQLRFERTPVDDVDQAVDSGEFVASAHAPEQRFGRRPGLGRVQPDALVHRAHGRGDIRPTRPPYACRAAACRNGSSSRASCSTTVTGSTGAHAGRTIETSSGATSMRARAPTISRTRSARARASSRVMPTVGIASCTVTRTVAGHTIRRPLGITTRLPDTSRERWAGRSRWRAETRRP